MPLMPSPGMPNTTSTPQSWSVSIKTSAAVFAISTLLVNQAQPVQSPVFGVGATRRREKYLNETEGSPLQVMSPDKREGALRDVNSPTDEPDPLPQRLPNEPGQAFGL